MTDIEKLRDWLKGFDGIPDNFQVDYTSEVPHTAGLFPSGLMEIGRESDIGGNVTVTNQYNFALYINFSKPVDADEISSQNAEWVMRFQDWVQEQSIMEYAPKFGNVDQWQETIKAQNGLFYNNKDSGVGTYMVTITVKFKKYFKSGGN